jgi:hypothetical protein
MTAGNDVAINRDYTTTVTTTTKQNVYNPVTKTWKMQNVTTTTTVNNHSRMDVTLDDRIITGQIDMPGLPKDGGGSGQKTYLPISWKGTRGANQSDLFKPEKYQ